MNSPTEIIIFGVHMPVAVFSAIAGAAVGSVITLVGVLVQNLFENARTKQRLKHEAKEREIERLQNTKRQIYLEAAVEFSKATKYLHRAFDFSFPPNEHEALLAGYDSAIAKVHLIANLETIKALQLANETFQAHVVQIYRTRRPYLQKIEQLKALQVRMNEDLQTRQNLISRFEQAQRANPNDPELALLSQKFSAVQAQIEQMQMVRENLDKEIHEGTHVVHEATQIAVQEYSQKLRLVNVAARKELALSFSDDGTEYLSLLQASADRQTALVNEFMSELRPNRKENDSAGKK